MRLPRRVPWAHLSELEQVCAWIYADESNMDAKTFAVNRLAAWKAITSLPHALESTHALLTAMLQDTALCGQSSSSYLSLRQSYATAVIRLVNGLVDPLQGGAYARSISSIATQLGLPASLVELRHAATHEDLPSIDVLREAARQAMAWLLQNYFLPTINPSTPAVSSSQRGSLRPLAPLLKQYKALAKATARDASLVVRYKHEAARVLRDVERWIAEAKVAAPGAATVWDDTHEGDDGEEGDAREYWALERLTDALLERGALVPMSKKKRLLSSPAFDPPASALRIWTPLLEHLHSLHPALPATLIMRAISHLSSQEVIDNRGHDDADVVFFDAEEVVLLDSEEKHKQDTSYDRCLACWAKWLVDAYERKDGEEDLYLSRADVVSKLVVALGPTGNVSGARERTLQDLLRAVCRGNPGLEDASALALEMPTPTSSGQTWQDADMQLMHDRLSTLLSLTRHSSSSSLSVGSYGASMDASPAAGGPAPRLPHGWRRVAGDEGWTPSPIGVFVPCAAR